MAIERSLQASTSVLATNKVIKNTYMLLSATLLFSALMAGVSIVTAMPPMTYLIAVIGAFVLGALVGAGSALRAAVLLHGVRHRTGEGFVPQDVPAEEPAARRLAADGAGACDDELLADDPDLGLVRARDRRLAAG